MITQLEKVEGLIEPEFIDSWEDFKEALKQKISGNIIKLVLNEYSTEGEKVYQIVKGMTPLELSVDYNRIGFDNGAEEVGDFEGFDAKSDIIDIILQFVDNVTLPKNIDSKDVMGLINKKYCDYKQKLL